GDARRPGDVWRIRWAAGQLAGYAICCPECGGVHCWTTARGCRVDVDASGDCEHRRAPTYGSCWTRAGAPEQGTLSASPPLDTRELEGRELDGPDPEGSEPGARCTFAGLLRCGWLVW
ncbi:MAG TPA: hypothetical protein VNA89_11985, partial [Gemmatimonadaceae bacterium]|nr:hypothetical protein [Gemmatimonadaceae bacterium]